MRHLLPTALVALTAVAAGPAPAQQLAKQIFSVYDSPTSGPATAIGSYSRGCLAGGRRVPEAPARWQLMRPSRDRHWAHPRTIAVIESLAEAARRNGWPGLYVGDISQARGGPMATGHRSHQTGLDVDIWLRRPDRMDLSWDEREQMSSTVVVASDGVSVNEHWTPSHHAIVRAAAADPAVARVFVNPAIKRALCAAEPGSSASRDWLGKVRPWTGHDAHFHVRLTCPADDPACVDQFDLPPGDGCGAELDNWFSDEGMLEIGAATRGITSPELTLADLPSACRSLAELPAGAGTGQVAALRPPDPIETSLAAIYGIEGSKYLWVLTSEAGNDGESGMALEVEGTLPPGLTLARGLNGRGLIKGVPTTAGDYAFALVARGPDGVYARYRIAITIEPRRTAGGAGVAAGAAAGGAGAAAGGDRVRAFLQGYDGGDCFYAHAVRILDAISEVEAFSREVAPLHRLDAAFLAAMGFEARIGGRIVADGHCGALSFARRVARGNAPAPAITLDDVTIGTGDYVSGLVETPPGSAGLLLHVDSGGGIDFLAHGMSGLRRFSRQIAGATGPHLLVALALPGDERAIPLSGGARVFDSLQTLDAVAGGRAGIAVKYFTVQ